MPQMVHVPGVFGFGDGELGEAVVGALVEQEKLPPDFFFRLLTVDPEERPRIAATDVLAAMGVNPPSPESADYLHAELPNCVMIPTLNFGSIRDMLGELPEDYHMYRGLRRIVDQHDRPLHEARQLWDLLIGILDPALHVKINELLAPQRIRPDAGLGKHTQYGYALGRTIIKDSAIMNIYENAETTPGVGSVRVKLLQELLADNHPELDENAPPS